MLLTFTSQTGVLCWNPNGNQRPRVIVPHASNPTSLGLLSCGERALQLCFYYLAVLHAGCSSINLHKYTIFISNKPIPLSQWLTSSTKGSSELCMMWQHWTKLKSKETHQGCPLNTQLVHSIQYFLGDEGGSLQNCILQNQCPFSITFASVLSTLCLQLHRSQ